MSGKSSASPFLEQVREAIRVRHYSIRTEQAYVEWIRRFILFHGKRHPKDMTEQEVGQFLTDLAVHRHVAPSTQNQALNALVFLYREVLESPLGEIGAVVRAKQQQRLPVVLTRAEVAGVLRRLDGPHWLIGCLLYGSGLRLMECLRLRVKDVDFAYRAIHVSRRERCGQPVEQAVDRLIGAGLERCRALGGAAVAVLGHPTYYPRFGFVPAKRFALRCQYEVPEEAFMALALRPGNLDGVSGTVRYQAAFASV